MVTKISSKNRPISFLLDKDSLNKGNRLDCKYYDPKYAELEEELSQLSKIVYLDKSLIDVTDGEHGKRMYIDDGILFLRISNIKEDGFDLDNVTYISSVDHYGRLNRARLSSGDVVMTTTGTVGVSQVISKGFPEANISADVAKITIKDSTRLMPEYLALFLNSELGRLQTERLSTGGSRDRIIQKDVHKIRLRLLSHDAQKEIVEATTELQEKANRQLGKYLALTSSIGKILTRKLNIDLPMTITRAFKVSKERMENRLDCFFNSPDLDMLHHALKKAESRKGFRLIYGNELNQPEVRIDKAEYEKLKLLTFRYIDISAISRDFGNITQTKDNILLNLPTRARQKVQTNDLLLPRPIGSNEGVTIVPKELDGQICSTGFIVIRPKNEADALLLWTTLRSDLVQRQFYYLQSGSIQPEITPENFKRYVLIPFIEDFNLRNEILTEAHQMIKDVKDALQSYRRSKKEAMDFFLKMVKGYRDAD